MIKKLNIKIEGRTSNVKVNILASTLIKGVSVFISFLLVPLTLGYLNADEYGVWLTLSSILTWINYFDIGLANGLRNKLAEAISTNNVKLGQTYVSTTFALLTIIMLVFFLVFSVINSSIEWENVLKTTTSYGGTLNKLVFIVFAFFCLQFIFRTVGTILIAAQRPALNDLLGVVGNLLSLLIIYILTKLTPGSLYYVAITFSAAPVLIFLIAYFILFYGKYKYLKPTISSINFSYSKDLIGLGVQFFIIQIAVCIVIYSSTNIIIAQLYGSESVTIYNVAYKFFYSLSMAYIIIIMPFWSASTDAYIKKDFFWIQSSLRKLLIVFFGSLVLLILMLLFSNIFYKFWVGDSVKVPFSLSVVVALYVALFNWSNTFIYFVNGIGKIRLQLYATVVVAVFYVPFAVYLGKTMGINGVVLASAISLIPTSILMPIQCVKLYKEKATGIWNK
jgi:O-antigen/teichoic acid export membrane protein